MSINWVMLDDSSRDLFVKLPNEDVLYSSPSRTSFTLTSTGSTKKLSLSSTSGIVHLTNQRIVYLPAQRTRELESFSCPINHLHDTHVAAPFFGANYWTAVVQPVADGGLTSTTAIIELKLTFKEGGAFDFYTLFERVKERFLQALEAARDQGRPMDSVHLQELPPYEAPPPGIDEPGMDGPGSGAAAAMGPPPGYEEVQRESQRPGLGRRRWRCLFGVDGVCLVFGFVPLS